MMMLAAAAWLPARPLPRKAVHLRLGGPVMTDSDLDMDLLSSRIRDHKAGLMDCKLYVIVQSMVPGQRITVTAPPSGTHTPLQSRRLSLLGSLSHTPQRSRRDSPNGTPAQSRQDVPSPPQTPH